MFYDRKIVLKPDGALLWRSIMLKISGISLLQPAIGFAQIGWNKQAEKVVILKVSYSVCRQRVCNQNIYSPLKLKPFHARSSGEKIAGLKFGDISVTEALHFLKI